MLSNHPICDARVAYFSMEIALRPEMHTYSGGLGVLAGDTVRSCADLGLPVVFVTLVSRQGYLRQRIDERGRQEEQADPWNPQDWCRPLSVMSAVTLDGREVWIRAWLYEHHSDLGGRAAVLLLDTDLEQNAPEDRALTDRLYGDGREYRLKQEAVLGIGGVRLLQALDVHPDSYHLNEGHAAFLTLELLRRHRRTGRYVRADEPHYQASQVRKQCIFTTHTPVEAGHDKFPHDLVQRVLGDYMAPEELVRFGGEPAFNMTRLALNLSGYVNGVARRHAETTTQMFPDQQVRAVTNGVHPGTWVHPAFAALFDTHMPEWRFEPERLSHADQLADDAVWEAHQTAQRELIDLLTARGSRCLDPELPIIGFARRMTSYKRADLLFSDIDRLCAIAKKRPFQLVIAGKAHPKDTAGKELIAQIHERLDALCDIIPAAFLENYDFALAKPLVAGVDVWLNTPLPPMEASGTSGMKAAFNGVLNLSVIDGWWVEGWVEGVTGWAIGEDGVAIELRDDAAALYEQLETKVLPLYHDDRARWIWMMKQAIAKLAPYFNSHRMMRRYASEAYLR